MYVKFLRCIHGVFILLITCPCRRQSLLLLPFLSVLLALVFVLFLISLVMFDYYKIVTSCWLLWQPVAVSSYCHRFTVGRFCLFYGDK